MKSAVVCLDEGSGDLETEEDPFGGRKAIPLADKSMQSDWKYNRTSKFELIGVHGKKSDFKWLKRQTSAREEEMETEETTTRNRKRTRKGYSRLGRLSLMVVSIQVLRIGHYTRNFRRVRHLSARTRVPMRRRTLLPLR